MQHEVIMITEPCLVATKRDCKALYKIMLAQIKESPFTVNFEFDCSEEEYKKFMEEEDE